MCLMNCFKCAGGTTAGFVSCFHVLSAYSGYRSRKAAKPLPPTLKTLPTPGHWMKGNITELNESLNRCEIVLATCFSCGDAQGLKVTEKWSGCSFSFPAKSCWKQNDSLLICICEQLANILDMHFTEQTCHLLFQPLVKLRIQLSQVFCTMILHIIYISDLQW